MTQYFNPLPKVFFNYSKHTARSDSVTVLESSDHMACVFWMRLSIPLSSINDEAPGSWVSFYPMEVRGGSTPLLNGHVTLDQIRWVSGKALRNETGISMQLVCNFEVCVPLHPHLHLFPLSFL